MDIEKLKEKVLSVVPEAEFEPNKQYMTVVVGVEKYHLLAKSLKESEETTFDYLFCLSGVDFVKHFMVVCHLSSTKYNHTIVLKAKITDRENPAVDSVTDLWNTAEFHEREVFEMLGIKFNNHPDLRKLFLPDDWVGFPLRKDFVDPVNIVEL